MLFVGGYNVINVFNHHGILIDDFGGLKNHPGQFESPDNFRIYKYNTYNAVLYVDFESILSPEDLADFENTRMDRRAQLLLLTGVYMGSPDTEPGRCEDESLQQEALIRVFIFGPRR